MTQKKHKILIYITISTLIFLNLLECVSAQSYNIHEIVGPGEHRVYSTSFNDNEVGLGWVNYVSFYISVNRTSTEIYFVNSLGYNEFTQNQNLNDISQGNIIRKFHFEYPTVGYDYNVSVVRLHYIYIIVNNSDIANARWHIIIYPWSIPFLETIAGRVVIIGSVSTIVLYSIIIIILYIIAVLSHPKIRLKKNLG